MIVTKAELVEIVSPTFKKRIDDEYVEVINAALEGTDELLVEEYKDNLVSYQRVMADGKYKVSDYVNAVKYVGYKIMGQSNTQAYEHTFPDKWNRILEKLRADGMSEADIVAKGTSPYVHSYNSGKLVNEIYKQSMVPFYTPWELVSPEAGMPNWLPSTVGPATGVKS